MLKREPVAFALFLAVCSAALLTAGGPGGSIHAQSCNPAVISYIVRDESGNVLSEAELKTVYERLPETIDSARLFTGEVAFADDGMSFYWPESLDWKKGKKVPSLQFINNETCVMSLTEVTITYHDKSMRLIFNINITRTQRDRRPVIDSLPFQEGTFSLDLSGWSHETHKMIPSDRWKKVRDRA
ncbi:MAG TPA: hypothetical protein VNO14_19570 [Blastocatellia bacterium]|nr:hypothetical protein [Blastocatellia bacterium]